LICRNIWLLFHFDLHQNIFLSNHHDDEVRNAIGNRSNLPSASDTKSILTALIQAIRKYRQRRKSQNELLLCSVAEISAIARDLRLSPDELMRLITEKTETAMGLHELLLALGIDAKSLELENPTVMRELQRLCLTCHNRPECAFHLAQGTVTEQYRNFCPNSYLLEDLTAARPAAWRGRNTRRSPSQKNR
jgi:AraC-like DNA-binding protein